MGLSESDKKKRATGLGASEMSAVLEMSPWSTGMDVWLEKTERADERPDTFQSRVGHLNEETAARLYCEEMKIDERTTLLTSPTLRARDQKIALATPDRFLCDADTVPQYSTFRLDGGDEYDGLHMRDFVQNCARQMLELKNVGYRVLPHWRGTGGSEYDCPDYVMIQAFWQMRVVPGIDIVDVAALLGGTHFQSWRFTRDQPMLDDMSELAERWWHKYVEADTPPPVDGGSAWKNYVHKRYPDVKKTPMLEATAGSSELAAEHIAAKLLAKQAKERFEVVETALKDLIGENPGIEGMMADGRKWGVTWKKPASGGRAWKSIAADIASETGMKEADILRIISANTVEPERKFLLKERT